MSSSTSFGWVAWPTWATVEARHGLQHDGFAILHALNDFRIRDRFVDYDLENVTNAVRFSMVWLAQFPQATTEEVVAQQEVLWSVVKPAFQRVHERIPIASKTNKIAGGYLQAKQDSEPPPSPEVVHHFRGFCKAIWKFVDEETQLSARGLRHFEDADRSLLEFIALQGSSWLDMHPHADIADTKAVYRELDAIAWPIFLKVWRIAD